jgi:hypothetical protein
MEYMAAFLFQDSPPAQPYRETSIGIVLPVKYRQAVSVIWL